MNARRQGGASAPRKDEVKIWAFGPGRKTRTLKAPASSVLATFVDRKPRVNHSCDHHAVLANRRSLEDLCALPNRIRSSATFCHRTHPGFSPVRSHMGSGRASRLHAINSLRHTRVQPVLLGFLCRGRALCQRVSSVRGGPGVAARRSFRRDFGAPARHPVGVRSQLCRHGHFELEIPLRHTSGFFNLDCGLFDLGGVAPSEAAFNLTPETFRAP